MIILPFCSSDYVSFSEVKWTEESHGWANGGPWTFPFHGRADGGSWTFPFHIWALLSDILVAADIVGSRRSSSPSCPHCQNDYQVSFKCIFKEHKQSMYNCSHQRLYICTNITGPFRRYSVCHRRSLFWCPNQEQRFHSSSIGIDLSKDSLRNNYPAGMWFSKFKQHSQHQPVSHSSSL